MTPPPPTADAARAYAAASAATSPRRNPGARLTAHGPVSYTHLTLPTILLV